MRKQQDFSLIKEFKSGNKYFISRIDENGLDPDLYRDCLEQGFLPGTKIQVLSDFKSQKKLLTIISEQTTVAIPYTLAEKIYVQYD